LKKDLAKRSTHLAGKYYPSAFQNIKFFEKVQIVLEISQFENCQISENPGSGDLYATFGAKIHQIVSGIAQSRECSGNRCENIFKTHFKRVLMNKTYFT